MTTRSSAATAAVVVSAFAASCSGAVASGEILVTSPTGYTFPNVDVSAFANGSYTFTNGPVSLPGGITFTANPGSGFSGNPNGNSGKGSVIGQGYYGLGGNGSFGGDATYIGVDSGGGYDTLTFSKPVSTFGAYWNYAPALGTETGWTDPTISTFTQGGAPIASFDLATLAPISTPGGFDSSQFLGVVDSTAQIGYVEFGGSYLLLAGTPTSYLGPPGTPTGSVAPEPSTWAMMGLGFAGLAFAGCRSRRSGLRSLVKRHAELDPLRHEELDPLLS